MRNPLTIRIETRFGVIVILFWAVIFTLKVYRAVDDFTYFLQLMQVDTPIHRSVARVERDQMSRWLSQEGLNMYGDPADTIYAGGTPLFDESTGEPIDRETYIVRKFPNKPWKSAF